MLLRYAAPTAPSWAAVDVAGHGCPALTRHSDADDDQDVLQRVGGGMQQDDDDLAALGLDASDLQHFFGDDLTR
jgi:hypothetical protein